MTTGIKLDKSTKDRLKSLGNQIDRSPHWIMKTAIEEYLTNQERYWQERQEDLARWENYQLTGEGIPHADVGKWLDDIATGKEPSCPV